MTKKHEKHENNKKQQKSGVPNNAFSKLKMTKTERK